MLGRHARWGLLAGVAAGLVAVLPACSDDGGKGCTGPFCVADLPDLEFDPDDRERAVVEGGLEVGESLVLSVTVINSGVGVLRLSDVTLDYAPPAGADDGDAPAFELLPPAGGLPLDVFALDGDEFPKGAALQVRFTRKEDGLARAATLTVRSNDPLEPDASVTFTTETGAPRLAVDRTTVDFGLVPKNVLGSETLNLLNTGSRTLNVSGFEILKDARFGVRGADFEIGGGDPLNPVAIDLPKAIQIPRGGAVPLELVFFSDSPSPAEGNLLIYSDDPQSGATGLLVPLTANKTGACILVEPRKVVFGGKLVGTPATVDVKLTSCGTKPLSVSGITLTPDSSEDFAVDAGGLPSGAPNPANPLVIPVNESVLVPVTFVPDSVNPKDADNVPIPDEGTLVVESDAFENRVEVSLSGAGAEQECPEAVILVEEGEEVVPQTVLHLDGTQSYAPFGEIAQWIWTVEQPEGNQQTLVPSPTDPQPVFAANVVGLYTFRLEVRDERNTKSCQPAVYQVLVQPDQAIHVELTWRTPGDPDETDSGEAKGSDMDLHFTHPSATGPDLDGDGAPDPWFDLDWDAFWYNPNPNWASFDPSVDDDPSLDRDDTDGAGPENLNLGIPEEGVSYRVAVHYWDSHGFGDAYATVRIFSYATEIYAREEILLEERDMWCVGSVAWPEAVVTPCGEDGLEAIVPDYVNPFFFTP